MLSTLKQSYVQWLKDFEWAYFVALHFKVGFSPTKEIAEQKVRHLCTRLNRFLNGAKSKINLSVFAVFETSKAEVPHVHILIGSENKNNIGISDVREAIAYYWGKLALCVNPVALGSANEGWFADTDCNKERVIEYMCKEFDFGRDPVLVGALKIPDTK